MRFQEESYTNIKDDIKDLLKSHWEEVELYQDDIEMNPDWDQYFKLSCLGVLRIYTARDEDRLVGYCILLVNNSLHYKDRLLASCDLLYVKPEARKGLVGYNLIKYAEEKLKQIGVSVVQINTKTYAPFDKLLERMDFSLIERSYSKYIGN